MPFGNITTVYLKAAAGAPTQPWGTNVRGLADTTAGSNGKDTSATTNHGTGGAVRRTVRPYQSGTASDLDESLYGWAIAPADMGGAAGARRFYPAGDHVLRMRCYNSSTFLSASGTLHWFAYRVGVSPDYTRTLIASGDIANFYPAGIGNAELVVTMALPEVILEPDETIQYAFEATVAGVAVTGRTITFVCGLANGLGDENTQARIVTPRLGVLADGVFSAAGGSAAQSVGAAKFSSGFSAAGSSDVQAVGASIGSGVFAAAGEAVADAVGGSFAGTVFSAAAVADSDWRLVNLFSGVFSADGLSDAQALGTGIFSGVFDAAGSSAAEAFGAGIFSGVFDAEGSSDADYRGSSVAGTVFEAAGAATTDTRLSVVLGAIFEANVSEGGGDAEYPTGLLRLRADGRVEAVPGNTGPLPSGALRIVSYP
jgi:hypothetical protein